MPAEGEATVSELIQIAALRFRAAGVVKPRREANRLWAWMSRSTSGETWMTRQAGADPGQRTAFEAAVARRSAGEPMAYVLGSAGFRRLDLRSDRRALIPRPETEGLVELVLSLVRTGRVVDIGTGSGCVALALAQEGSFQEVVGADVSIEALELARENAGLTGLPVGFVESDCGAGLPDRWFDLVICNPPYLTDDEYHRLDVSVKAWEPRLALAGGPDGLATTRAVLREGIRLLAPGGWLAIELDSTRGAASAALAVAEGYQDVRVWDDLFGRQRYLTARQGHSG